MLLLLFLLLTLTLFFLFIFILIFLGLLPCSRPWHPSVSLPAVSAAGLLLVAATNDVGL
jgi:hypothetical protein